MQKLNNEKLKFAKAKKCKSKEMQKPRNAKAKKCKS